MQGFNMGRYVPPDVEGTISGNKLHKKHALGARASKLSQGILTVRFEMPFAVWCSTCPKPTIIGQGVRFNAEKKKVGNYHSSSIFSFRLRHVDCGGVIEIRTDPKNTEYVVTEGGKRRDTGDDKVVEGDTLLSTEVERQALRASAFAKLEKTIEDREQLVQAKLRIEELHEANDRIWEDPYEQNRRLRREFRVGRHRREKDDRETEDLKERMSLGIALLPGNELDAKRAMLIDFGATPEGLEGTDKALVKPLFGSQNGALSNPEKSARRRLERPELDAVASMEREKLASEIVRNTRMAQDPFLAPERSTKKPRFPGIKRKREAASETVAEDPAARHVPYHAEQGVPVSKVLVGYESDSE